MFCTLPKHMWSGTSRQYVKVWHYVLRRRGKQSWPYADIPQLGLSPSERRPSLMDFAQLKTGSGQRIVIKLRLQSLVDFHTGYTSELEFEDDPLLMSPLSSPVRHRATTIASTIAAWLPDRMTWARKIWLVPKGMGNTMPVIGNHYVLRVQRKNVYLSNYLRARSWSPGNFKVPIKMTSRGAMPPEIARLVPIWRHFYRYVKVTGWPGSRPKSIDPSS